MESRVSGNCTRNIHSPPTPEKEVNRKENIAERLPEGDRLESVCMTKKIGIFRARFIGFPSMEFPMIYCTVKDIFRKSKAKSNYRWRAPPFVGP